MSITRRYFTQSQQNSLRRWMETLHRENLNFSANIIGQTAYLAIVNLPPELDKELNRQYPALTDDELAA